jgi:Flp pilus assembly protein TadG
MFMVTRNLRSRRDRGAAAVELALVLPLLVMILFGIVEFGYAFFIQGSVASAARVGVRDYSINYSKPNSAATAIAVAKLSVPVPADVVSAAFTTACATPGAQTTLVLTYRYHSLTGLLDGVLGSNNITVTGKGSMACGG